MLTYLRIFLGPHHEVEPEVFRFVVEDNIEKVFPPYIRGLMMVGKGELDRFGEIVLSSENKDCVKRFGKLREKMDHFGFYTVLFCEDDQEYQLGLWLAQVKHRYHSGKLSEDEVRFFESQGGWNWNE